jgi:hypothetical protein
VPLIAGIPKFYRWLSERYPLINMPGGATVVPIMDNFYLDMNGIIHNCTHGNNPDVKLTEDEMIMRIFTYLDRLFHIVKPQKLMLMAIDGVWVSRPTMPVIVTAARRAIHTEKHAHMRHACRSSAGSVWQCPAHLQPHFTNDVAHSSTPHTHRLRPSCEDEPAALASLQGCPRSAGGSRGCSAQRRAEASRGVALRQQLHHSGNA